MSIFDLNWLLSLILFSAILLGTPGPAVIALFHSGATFGFKRTFPFFSGMILGFFLNLQVSVLGISVLREQETVFEVFKYIMLGYVFYLSYKIATSKPLNEEVDSRPMSFYQGLFLNILNPKAYIAALSAISQFSIANDYMGSLVIIIAVNLLLAIILQGLWCGVGNSLQGFFTHPKRYRLTNYFLAILLIVSVTYSYFE